MDNEIKKYSDILSKAIEEHEYLIKGNNLLDAFTFYAKIKKVYSEEAVKYFKDIVIDLIIEREKEGSLDTLPKNAVGTSYNLIKNKIAFSDKEISLKEFLLYQKEKKKYLTLELGEYVSNAVKMNLSEKVHEIYLRKLNIPYIKTNRGKERVDFAGKNIGRLTMDFILGDGKAVSTNKIIQGTSGSEYIVKNDFLYSIEFFKEQYNNLKYNYLLIILDFPNLEKKDMKKDWKKSYANKIKLIDFLKENAEEFLDDKIFIGRFKDLYDNGVFDRIK